VLKFKIASASFFSFYLFSAFFFLLFDNLSAEFGNLSFTRFEFQQIFIYYIERSEIETAACGGISILRSSFRPHGKKEKVHA